MKLPKSKLEIINQQESVQVRYTGRIGWWGSEPYIAKPFAVMPYLGNAHAVWQIEDPDGDYFTVAPGTLMDGLVKGWEVVADEPTTTV